MVEIVEILSLLEGYAIGLRRWQNSIGHEFILHLHYAMNLYYITLHKKGIRFQL